MASSISFRIDGPVDTRITITEQADGTLFFELDVLGSGRMGDLRGFYFDLTDPITGLPILPETLVATGDDITSLGLAPDAVADVGPGTNVQGLTNARYGPFDGGIGFGTPGRARDDIQSTSFVLGTQDGTALTLESFDLADFALRYTSAVGPGGGGSKKIGGTGMGIARDDAFTVTENVAGEVALLANDSAATGSMITNVIDGDGDFERTATGFERLVVIDGLELGTLQVAFDGTASFTADGADVDRLGHDAAPTFDFVYESTAADGTSIATADVKLTVDGVNDRPLAGAVALVVGEDDGSAPQLDPRFGVLDGDGVTGAFVGSDVDIGDTLRFAIVSDPMDAFGNQYGSVVDNGDGTFTFDPGDEFQFLDAGETRDVTFRYVAIDDSGVGPSPLAPEEADISEAATVTVTVVGADDAPIVQTADLAFATTDQSQWVTGPALIEEWSDFYGIDTGRQSLDATILPGYTLSGDALTDLANFFEDFLAVFGADVDVPDSISTPSLSTEGFFDLRAGVMPYFVLDSGSVDANAAVEAQFVHARQVESGETFTLDSAAFFGETGYETTSPYIQFGFDVVFDLAAKLDLVLGGTSLFGGSRTTLLDFDTGAIAGFTGTLGEPGFNLFDFDSRDPDLSISFRDPAGIGTLTVEPPFIETSGAPVNGDPTRLASDGEDMLASATLDIDNLISEVISKTTGVPFAFGTSGSFGAGTTIAGTQLKLLTFDYAVELLDLDFVTELLLAQDFELEIGDLPMMLAFEDGTTIDGFVLGDEIDVTAPTTAAFDAAVMGDGDGLVDVEATIDIEALFSNLTGLELDFFLTAGLIKMTGGLGSSLLPSDWLPSVSLSDFVDTGYNGEDFLYYEELPIADDVRVVDLFDDTFNLEGWNQAALEFAYDVA